GPNRRGRPSRQAIRRADVGLRGALRFRRPPSLLRRHHGIARPRRRQRRPDLRLLAGAPSAGDPRSRPRVRLLLVHDELSRGRVMSDALNPTSAAAVAAPPSERAGLLFESHRRTIVERTDRLFAFLLVAEWLSAIGAALWISPRTWIGATSET